MRKQEFLEQLGKELSGLPREDREECLSFYKEMIEDRMEEGLSEEEAVSAAGTVEEIVSQVGADIPLAKTAKETTKPKRRTSGLQILLLILGSPIWLSLGIAAFAVVFSLYVSLWSVIISLWAVFASLAACSIAGVLACAVFAVGGNGPVGLAMLAAAMVCAGMSIFAFCGCKAATSGTLLLTKKTGIRIKSCLIRKEEVS